MSRVSKKEVDYNLLQWEIATQSLAINFVHRYFGKDTSDVYWVADDIGIVLVVNDYFFNLDRIIDALKYNASSEKLFDFYQIELDCHTDEKDMPYNFRNFLKIKK